MGRFNANKCKVHLKLAINRLKMLAAKKNSINNQQRREIATLLEKGKDESARVKVERIILEDLNMEAMEILELYCDTLLARFSLLEQMKHCDPGIAESVNSVIYAAPRAQVKELILVRDQLISKFGQDFGMAAMENSNDVVNPRIVQKLRISQPDPFLVTQYLKEIARAYNISWEPPNIDLTNPNAGFDPSDDAGGSSLPADLASLLPPLSSDVSPLPPQQAYPVNYQSTHPTQAPVNHQQPSYPPSQQSTNIPPPGAMYPPTGYDNNDPSQNTSPAKITSPSSDGMGDLPQFPVPPSDLGAKDSDSFLTSDTSNTAGGANEDVPDFDELSKRFEALKKKS